MERDSLVQQNRNSHIQKNDSQLMAEPLMPSSSKSFNEIIDVQEQMKELYKLEARARLKQMNTMYVKTEFFDSCHDILQCCPAATQTIVKLDKNQQKGLFRLRFEEFQCLTNKLQGEFVSLDEQQNEEEKIYGIEHNRPLFCVKCGLMTFWLPGTCAWFGFHFFFPPESKLIFQDESEVLYKFNYSMCAGDVTVTEQIEGKDHIKFIIKNESKNIKKVYDSENKEIEDVYIKGVYVDKCGCLRKNAIIQFPEGFKSKDKAAIIFSMMRSN